jgi:hypothetical protein
MSVLKSLAAAELRKKDCGGAIRSCRKILTVLPDDEDAVYGLELAYDQEEHLKEASLWYKRFVAIAVGPTTNKSLRDYARKRIKEFSAGNLVGTRVVRLPPPAGLQENQSEIFLSCARMFSCGPTILPYPNKSPTN